MQEAEFDRVADEYAALHTQNISASGESPEYFHRYKVRDTAEAAAAAQLQVSEALDFGCGIGNSLPHLRTSFPQARVTGADVSQRSLEIARSRVPDPMVRLERIREHRLPLADHSVDLVFTACVFHHIAPEEHAHWLAELRRVTRPGGLLMLFEHNPWNPLTCGAVRACPFDDNAVLITAPRLCQRVAGAGWVQPRVVYRIFYPRALAFARPTERWLRRLPLGAQYFVKATRP